MSPFELGTKKAEHWTEHPLLNALPNKPEKPDRAENTVTNLFCGESGTLSTKHFLRGRDFAPCAFCTGNAH